MLPNQSPESVKHDAGKSALDLLPFAALNEVGKVLQFGAQKYSSHNWRNGQGLSWSRLLAAALRHLFAWGRGENADPETGLNHLAHAACCVLFLLDYSIEGGGTDNRWKSPTIPIDNIPKWVDELGEPVSATTQQIMNDYDKHKPLPENVLRIGWVSTYGGKRAAKITYREGKAVEIYEQ